MKVVLVRPPKVKGAIERSMVQHPINLLSLAAVLEREGHELQVWDFEVEPFSEQIVRQKAENFEPGAAGITSLTCNIKTANQIAGWIKSASPETFTVAGGPHTSAIPARALEEFPNLDAVVIGEGEITLKEICDRVSAGRGLEGVLGCAWRGSQGPVIEDRRPLIENLDDLPYPARHLIDHSLYKGASSPGLDATLHRSTEIFTTRGCLDKCTFCASHLVFGRYLRARSAENILGEVDQCMEKWGYRHFTIEDDTFTIRPSRLEAICQGFKERGITWDCDTRVNAVTRDMIFMMADSGCNKIAFGVESGSPRILKLIKKNITIEQARNAFKWAHEAGIITTAFFMVGSHPSETKEDLKMSIDLMKELDTELMAVAVAVPYPGTDLYRIMKEGGFIDEERWEAFNHLHSIPTWHTEHFSARKLVRLQNGISRRFFLRPSFIWKTLPKAMSWHGMKYYTRSGIDILTYLFIEARV
jgi:anaerobic magnesium-protoporphyrin IX monomethyl ester cyclase